MVFFTSKGKSLFFLFVLVFSAFSLLSIKEVSASIYGAIYEKPLDTDTMKGAIIEINTTPIQKYVAKDGTYLFSLPIGTYNISVAFDSSTESLYTEKIINVEDNGKYRMDFVFKSIPKEETNNTEQQQQTVYGILPIYITYAMYTGGVILGLLIISLSFLIMKKSKSHEQDKQKNTPEKKPIQEPSEKSELSELIKLIKKNDGRMTQKDIRKEISLSEAKISLMISELEEKGTVKKIKKGRGNIIILNKE